jgi:hypothetical protein
VIHHAPKSASGGRAFQSVLLGSATNPRVSFARRSSRPRPRCIASASFPSARSAAKDRSEWLAGTSHPGPPPSRGALEIILTQNRGVPRTATARTLMVSGPLTLSGDVAADQRGEMALPRATAAAARSDQPEQRHRFGHAFEFVAAALLGDEQPAIWRAPAP